MNLDLDVQRLQSRARDSTRYYLRGIVREVASKNLFLWAQAIAFKVLVTVVPIVILATGLAGRVLRGNDAFATVARLIHDFLPPSQSNQLVSFLEQLQQASGTIVGVGGVGLFLSAVSLLITLRIAVGNAFEQDWHEGRSLLRSYLFDVRMVLQVGLLFALTIGLSVATQSIPAASLFDALGAEGAWMREGWRRLLRTFSLFVPFFITTAMFFQLYYFVPKPHPRKRSALTGALIAGALWEVAKQAFTYYATYVGRFDQYGPAEEGLNALGNTFGLIIAFVFWVYFSGVVLMVGAVIASLREHRHVTEGRLPGEAPDDEPVLAAPNNAGPDDAEPDDAGPEATGNGSVADPPAGDGAQDPPPVPERASDPS